MNKNDNVIPIGTGKPESIPRVGSNLEVGMECRNEDWEVFLKDSLLKRHLSFDLEDE